MAKDLLITPASGKLEFKTDSTVDAKLETDANGNLLITNPSGDISIGDTSADVYIGDGVNNVDIVFEQDGSIRGTAGVTLTLGTADSNVALASDLNLSGNDLLNVGTLSSVAIAASGTFTSTSQSADAVKTRFISGAAAGSTSDGPLYLQYGKSQDIRMFETSGANRKLYIYGNDNGTDRYGSLSIGTDGSFNVVAADTYLILSANNYVQSQKPHNFIGSLLMQGTVVLDTSRNLTNIGTISSGNIETSGYLRIDRSSQEIGIIFEDSGGHDTIFHTVNDSQGNYNIMLGVNGAGTSPQGGDGQAKILLTGHSQNGSVSLNAGKILTNTGDAAVYTIGLLVDSTDNTIRVGNPNSNVGLSTNQGTKIINTSGQWIGGAVLSTDIVQGTRFIGTAQESTAPTAQDARFDGFGVQGNRDTNPVYLHNHGDGGIRISSNAALGTPNGLLVTDTEVTVNGNLVAGNATTGQFLRAYYSDGASMTLQGYGLEMDRATSYIRPTTDGDKILYIGGSDASLDWLGIDLKVAGDGIKVNGTAIIDSSRNLTNINSLKIDTGDNYRDVSFTQTGNLGNGTLEIKPMTVPGSGTANYYTHFKNNGTIGSGGATRHDVRVDGNFQVGDATVIDSSRNLTNIGTISSGAITSTGTSSFANFQLSDSSKMGFGTVKASATVGHNASDDEGIFWHTTNGYGIYRTAGNWTSPDYSQLKIAWNTGITLYGGNNSAYTYYGVNLEDTPLKVNNTIVLDSSRNLTNIVNATVTGQVSTTTVNFTNILKANGTEVLNNSRDLTNINTVNGSNTTDWDSGYEHYQTGHVRVNNGIAFGAPSLASLRFGGSATYVPTESFVLQVLKIAVGNTASPASFDTWLKSTASDGFAYGDMLKTGSITSADANALNYLRVYGADGSVVDRWLYVVVPGMIADANFDSWVSAGLIAGANIENGITATMLSTDTLSFSGDSGQLFSITDSLSGTIFAVNDISGVPSIEVDDDGTIRLAETFGNVLIGTAVDDGLNKLQLNGQFDFLLDTTNGNRKFKSYGTSGVRLQRSGDTNGWAFEYGFLSNNSADHGGFGGYGDNTSLTYYYIGDSYNNSSNFRFYKNGSLRVGSTEILTSARNLTNIGTINGYTISNWYSSGSSHITLSNQELSLAPAAYSIWLDANDSDAPASLGDYVSTYPLGIYVNGDGDTGGGTLGSGTVQVYHTGHFSGTNISNWQTAYGWGDHSTAGYLTSESDTLATVTARGASTSVVTSFTNGTNSLGSTGGAVKITGGLGVGYNIYAGQVISAGGGFRVGSTSASAVEVIDSSRNLVNIGTISSGAITSTGNVTAYSDERLKKNVQTLDGKKVLQMRGVSFIKDGELGSGVIAQELERVAPELVKNGEYKSVAYGNLTGYLIEAIKEQQSQIERLEKLVHQLMEK